MSLGTSTKISPVFDDKGCRNSYPLRCVIYHMECDARLGWGQGGGRVLLRARDQQLMVNQHVLQLKVGVEFSYSWPVFCMEFLEKKDGNLHRELSILDLLGFYLSSSDSQLSRIPRSQRPSQSRSHGGPKLVLIHILQWSLEVPQNLSVRCVAFSPSAYICLQRLSGPGVLLLALVYVYYSTCLICWGLALLRLHLMRMLHPCGCCPVNLGMTEVQGTGSLLSPILSGPTQVQEPRIRRLIITDRTRDVQHLEFYCHS